MKRARLRIHGRVHGVFFRDSARREAERRGVAGWVSNEPDGTVELVLEGAEAGVDAVAEWARVGPPHARVTQVETSDQAPEGLAGFQVR